MVTVFATRGRQGHMPEGMPKGLDDLEWWAEAYRWTPDQVRSLTLAEHEWFPRVREARRKAAEILANQERNSAGR